MAKLLAASTLAAAVSGKVFFEDTFDSGIGERWVPSEWKVRLARRWCGRVLMLCGVVRVA